MEQQVRVCEKVAEQMLARGYVVFNTLENDAIVPYVYENQFHAFKESFRPR